MGLLHGIGRFLLIIINLVLVLVSLALIIFGCLVKYSADTFKSYTDTVLDKIKESAQGAFGDSDFNVENFDLSEMFGTVTSLLIGIGSVLFVISFLGSCGACCKVKCMLILYAVILVVLVLAQIVLVVFLLGYTSVLKQAMKSPLKNLLKNFKGMNSSNVESITWSFVMQEFQCCGLDGSEDFKQGDSQWFGEDSTDWNTPVPCCKALPTSGGNFDCAKTNGKNAEFNNYNKGCVDEIWKVLIEDNKTYTYLGAIAVLLFQVLMIVFAFLMYCKDDDGKVEPREDRPHKKKKRSNRSEW